MESAAHKKENKTEKPSMCCSAATLTDILLIITHQNAINCSVAKAK